MSETYYTGDVVRETLLTGSAEADAVFDTLRAAFSWVRMDDYFSVTAPAAHEILNEPVITAYMPTAQNAMLGENFVMSPARKFCMTSTTSFVRGYSVYTGPKPAWATPSSRILFVGTNHVELGRPAPEHLDEFVEYYVRAEPAEFEAAFNLPERRGAYETFYGVTVRNGEVSRVKQYVYDSQGGFSDWDVIHMMACKRIGRLDLV